MNWQSGKVKHSNKLNFSQGYLNSVDKCIIQFRLQFVNLTKAADLMSVWDIT